MSFEPVIKWSGSKRSQAGEILKYFPKRIDTYYEPFCGGGSILYALLKSDISCKHYVASDLNQDLINLWDLIKKCPMEIYEHYNKLWKEINSCKELDDKKVYFNIVRERFNKERNPLDYMFLLRTCMNGMPRYNREGNFNTSLHVTRNGIIPDTLKEILWNWYGLLNKNNVEFVCQSYDEVRPMENDFVYLDPPYANTKGMYYGAIGNDCLFNYLRGLKCGWAMSFDGVSGGVDNTYEVPIDIYDEHVYVKSGNSSFKRTLGIDNNAMVYESLYLKNCKKEETKKLF